MTVYRRSMIDGVDISTERDVPVQVSGEPAPGRWLMRKNCSLAPRQVLMFYLSLTTISFLFAGVFALQGLWLILPFAALENLVLAAALLYYARHALDREEVILDGDVLHVYVTDGSSITHHRFDAHWVRLEWRGRRSDALWLCQGDRSIPLGGYLMPDERRLFARDLRVALRARPFRTPPAESQAG